MKILILNEKIMQPDKSSGCKRLYAILEILSINHEIIYFSETKNLEDFNYRKMLEILNINVIEGNYKELFKLLKNDELDVCIFEFYRTAFRYLELIKALQPDVYTIVDSVDVHFARIQKEIEKNIITENYYITEKKKEILSYQKADLTLVVSIEDGLLLENESISKYFVVSNIVPIKPRKKIKRDKNVITFVGNFKHTPNVFAIDWFLNDIWDKIKEVLPETIFKIAGSDLPKHIEEIILNLKDVYYLGYIPDLDDLYNETVVIVAPLTYGGGVKGKVNEAMANGIPLVTTTIGIQGIPAVDSKHCFVTDDGSKFALKVIQLITNIDLQNEFSKNSQLLAQSTCGLDHAKLQIELLISFIKENRLKVINKSTILKYKLLLKFIVVLTLKFIYLILIRTHKFIYKNYRKKH